MNEKDKKRISKFLSLVLRHDPEHIDLRLDKNGWAIIDELQTKSKSRRIFFSVEELKTIVITNDKQRFSFNEDETKIRANQGHSVKTIDLEFEAVEPPMFLYHGTVSKFIGAIRKEGLQKRSRQHVHLSKSIDTAITVGSRRGKPLVLSVRTGDMFKKGFKFYQSKNDVWLTDRVPIEFINFKN
ncbi:RNA 2'-phosphotransferase [Lacinutrix mariniflava]|uniref:RNA 2'-phosphotransferase n=1 Tax=Lacinutrix mariniflava TaxID=342955 RepID=UPI0006E44AFC|nr:RNA 2'-phosphotransferase [Lacinutrix mariniflava]